MKLSTLNILFTIADLIGMPICIYGWQRWHQHLWLLGIGIFAYFLVSRLIDILLNACGQ
jgi:hypothetical protein